MKEVMDKLSYIHIGYREKNSLLSSGNSRNSNFTNSQKRFTNFKNYLIPSGKQRPENLYQRKSW